MRTIFIIPKMFTQEELVRINPNVPEDYPQKSQEFWNYVAEKLRSQRNVHKVYYDSLTKENIEAALEFIKKNNLECFNLVKGFVEAGAELRETEDSLLLSETASWAEMLNDANITATMELLAQSMKDRDKVVAKKIAESLKEGETGILFLAPGRETSAYFPSDLRVIKIQPFDPGDYVNSWLVTLKIREKSQAGSP